MSLARSMGSMFVAKRTKAKVFRLFVVALEPSGDVIAARAMMALKKLSGESFQFRGVGGFVYMK